MGWLGPASSTSPRKTRDVTCATAPKARRELPRRLQKWSVERLHSSIVDTGKKSPEYIRMMNTCIVGASEGSACSLFAGLWFAHRDRQLARGFPGLFEPQGWPTWSLLMVVSSWRNEMNSDRDGWVPRDSLESLTLVALAGGS